MQDLEQSIRERAYQLWIEGGYQDGHANAHWLAAQREIMGASLSELARVTIGETPPLASTKAKTPRKKQRAA
jgi:hypothetical protein